MCFGEEAGETEKSSTTLNSQYQYAPFLHFAELNLSISTALCDLEYRDNEAH